MSQIQWGVNPHEQAYLRYIMALGMTKGTYPPIDYFGASIQQREIQTAQRLKRWS